MDEPVSGLWLIGSVISGNDYSNPQLILKRHCHQGVFPVSGDESLDLSVSRF